jgi:hypothetical protein
MKRSKQFVFVALAMILSAAPGFTQQITASRETTIKAEINVFLDQYTRWFEADRADLIAERVYLAPSVRLDATGLILMASVDEIKRRWEGLLQPLIADGYTKSEWPTRNICILNDATAIVSGHFVRYRKNGSVIGEYGVTYTLTRTGDGWRITAVIPHEPGRVLQCAK